MQIDPGQMEVEWKKVGLLINVRSLIAVEKSIFELLDHFLYWIISFPTATSIPKVPKRFASRTPFLRSCFFADPQEHVTIALSLASFTIMICPQKKDQHLYCCHDYVTRGPIYTQARANFHTLFADTLVSRHAPPEVHGPQLGISVLYYISKQNIRLLLPFPQTTTFWEIKL